MPSSAEPAVRILAGREVVTATAEAVVERLSAFDRVVLDIGTGDGRYPLRSAREEPGTLFVGVDPVAENMADSARRARRKPARGGAPNVLYVVSSLEQLPGCFDGRADHVQVGYPWGSLLAAFVKPEAAALERLARLGAPGATVRVLLNYSVFEDPAYVERLGLPPFDVESARERLVPALARAGIAIDTVELFEGPAEERSTWERKLVAGSGRRSLLLAGYVSGSSSEST